MSAPTSAQGREAPAGDGAGAAAGEAERDDAAARRALDAFLRGFLSASGDRPDAGAALAASIPERSFPAEHRLRVHG